MRSLLARRRSEREARIEIARVWAGTLGKRLSGLRAAVVVGSVARGDFNQWSDLDVLVVAEGLPAGWRDRCQALSPLPPGLQAVAWSPAELVERRRRGDPMALEAGEIGVVVWGSHEDAGGGPAGTGHH
ncbi:MAG: nucleotidyltransferase domain-containing protein [Acidimicrobiia bacterium]